MLLPTRTVGDVTEREDGRRRQWLAVDSQYARSKLAMGLRERFGALGVLVFDLFLRACKRNLVQGEIVFNSQQDFLAQIGMSGLDLRDERGVPWDLEDFFTYLGQQKNTRRTRSGGLTIVRSTRWEEWENPRSKPKNVGPMPARNESGTGLDKTRQDNDNYNDRDSEVVVVEDEIDIPDSVWSHFARVRFNQQPEGTIRSPVRWMQATERMAREEHWLRAQHLLRHFDINHEQLVTLLLSEGSPPWLDGCRREA